MGLGDYLQLLDWTGRQIRSDKRGAMPANLEPLFERLGISTELWVACVLNFRKWFRSSVGCPKSIEAAAETRGTTEPSASIPPAEHSDKLRFEATPRSCLIYPNIKLQTDGTVITPHLLGGVDYSMEAGVKYSM